MKILILGAGAIGTMLGVALAEKNDVTFYVREAKKEKLKNGMSLKMGSITKTIEKPQCITTLSPQEIEQKFDLAIIAVKAYSLKDLLSNLDSELFKYILTCQNGIGNEEELIAKYGKDKVVSSVITLPASVAGEGKTEVTNIKGGIAFGCDSEKIPLKEIVDMFAEAGFNTITCDGYKSMKWSKVLLNMNSNALSAITSMTMEELFNSNSATKIEKMAFCEAFKLIEQENIKYCDLPGYPVKMMCFMYKYLPVFMIKFIMKVTGKAKSRGKKMPSLFIDLENGKSDSEIDVLNGAVVTLSKQLKQPAPYNEFLCNVFHELLTKKIDRDKYKNNPDKLLEDLKKYLEDK